MYFLGFLCIFCTSAIPQGPTHGTVVSQGATLKKLHNKSAAAEKVLKGDQDKKIIME
jgi:hypothetical protein